MEACMIFNVLTVLVVLAAVVVLYAFANTPKVVKISRTVLIQASPEVLFPYINNGRIIQEWNVFIEGDPQVKVTYAGPVEGVGAQWIWEGTKAGAGQATIITSEPNKNVQLRLDFKRPFKVTNYGEYALEVKGTETEVRWTINETALIPRVLSNFINLEKMIGAIFEKGLLRLKTLVEAKLNLTP
jgi:uncharacterized protein YndB with AHSA1/START domain